MPPAAHAAARRSCAPAPRPSPARRRAAPRPCAPRGCRSGRCSSRSPDRVAARARACPPPPSSRGGSSGSSSRDGRGQRTGAAISSRRVSPSVDANARAGGRTRSAPRARRTDRSLAACASVGCSPASGGHHDRGGGRNRHRRATRAPTLRLLGREQPPVGGLAAVAQLELDAAVEHALDVAQRRAARPSPASTLISSGAPSPSAPRASAREHRLAASRAGSPHARTSSSTKPDRVAALEAPLRVVARGGRDRARCAPARARRSSACAFSSTERSGASATAAASPACWLVVRRHQHLLVRQSRGVLGGHDHVRAVRQQDDLLGRHLVDRRPAGRRSTGSASGRRRSCARPARGTSRAGRRR